MQGHRQHFLVDVLGPCMAIYIIFQQGYWAHPKVSAASLGRSTGPITDQWDIPQQLQWAHASRSAVSLTKHRGPILGHQQYVCVAPTGPHECIGSIHWGSQLAHSCLSAEIFGHNNRPIQRYQQHFSGVVLAHAIPSAPHLGSYGGPIQGHRHQILMAMLGPFETIGSISY